MLSSGEHPFHNVACYVCQAEIAPHVAICQTGVVESKAPQRRGMQIVDVDLTYFKRRKASIASGSSLVTVCVARNTL